MLGRTGHRPQAMVRTEAGMMEGQSQETPTGLGQELDRANALFQSFPDGIAVVDRGGMIFFVNPRLEALFGYQAEELVGQSVEVLLPAGQRQVHAAHRLRYVADPQPRPMGQTLDLWGRRADGAEFPLEISLSPITIERETRTLAVVRDATARRAGQQELRTISDVLDGMGEAVFFGDPETLQFSYANQAAAALTGYSRSELLEMTPFHLLPTVTRADIADRVEELATGVSLSFATALRRRDGVDITVECEIDLPPVSKGTQPLVVAVVRDIGERLAQEAQRQAVHELSALVADRERIGRDLHDTAIQELFGAGLSLQAAALAADDPRLRDRLLDIVDRQDAVIRQIRTAIFGLTARHHGDSLTDQVQAVVNEASRMLGFRPSLEVSGPVDTVTGPHLAEQLLPALREALANVARHARATRVGIGLDYTDGSLTLRVSDDGVGLPGSRTPPATACATSGSGPRTWAAPWR